MADFKTVLTITVFVSAFLYTTGAPATDKKESNPILGSNNIPLVTEEPLAEKLNTKQLIVPPIPIDGSVTVIERFYRTYSDGTIEWKLVLSNGVAQYQKITHKQFQGRRIQVYEGYISELLPDNTYRTSFYIADENGYRLLRREFDTKPPVLPPYVPHEPTV